MPFSGRWVHVTRTQRLLQTWPLTIGYKMVTTWITWILHHFPRYGWKQNNLWNHHLVLTGRGPPWSHHHHLVFWLSPHPIRWHLWPTGTGRSNRSAARLPWSRTTHWQEYAQDRQLGAWNPRVRGENETKMFERTTTEKKHTNTFTPPLKPTFDMLFHGHRLLNRTWLLNRRNPLLGWTIFSPGNPLDLKTTAAFSDKHVAFFRSFPPVLWHFLQTWSWLPCVCFGRKHSLEKNHMESKKKAGWKMNNFLLKWSLFWVTYSWWFRNLANQLRLIVYPNIYRVFFTSQVVPDFFR